MINDRCPEKGRINSDWLYDKLMAIIASQQLLTGEIIKYRLHCGFEELLGLHAAICQSKEEILEKQTKHRKNGRFI